MHKAGKTNEEQAKLWNPKPIEELYDLEHDPKELNNLAKNPAFLSVKDNLRKELHKWMIKYKDLGLLAEAEYMRRSQGSTPYEYARFSGDYQPERILEAAERVGTASEAELQKSLKDEDSGVRYWGVIGLMQFEELSANSISSLEALLSDPSPSVQIAAAEAMCRFGSSEKAVRILGELVQSDQVWLALQAARSIQLIGEDARPLIPIIRKVLQSLLGEPGKRLKYKDFNYAAFTSWALEWALQQLGEEV